MGDVKQYSFTDVLQRNGQRGERSWIVYKNDIYDVTPYIQQHPGGVEPIAEYIGKDATQAIDDVGHSSDARTILAKFKVAEILESEQKYDANGKKKKRVVSAPEDGGGRSCLSIVTCGLLG